MKNNLRELDNELNKINGEIGKKTPVSDCSINSGAQGFLDSSWRLDKGKRVLKGIQGKQ